jgi:hypothetical protein
VNVPAAPEFFAASCRRIPLPVLTAVATTPPR